MEGYGLIVIMFFFGLAGGIIGRIKGSSFFMWFLISGLVPFLGLLAAIFYRFENQELRRECPGAAAWSSSTTQSASAVGRSSSFLR